MQPSAACAPCCVCAASFLPCFWISGPRQILLIRKNKISSPARPCGLVKLWKVSHVKVGRGNVKWGYYAKWGCAKCIARTTTKEAHAKNLEARASTSTTAIVRPWKVEWHNTIAEQVNVSITGSGFFEPSNKNQMLGGRGLSHMQAQPQRKRGPLKAIEYSSQSSEFMIHCSGDFWWED